MNLLNPAEVVSYQLSLCHSDNRGVLLREMLSHVAAGLVVVETRERAAEACYRLADAVVSREGGA